MSPPLLVMRDECRLRGVKFDERRVITRLLRETGWMRKLVDGFLKTEFCRMYDRQSGRISRPRVSLASSFVHRSEIFARAFVSVRPSFQRPHPSILIIPATERWKDDLAARMLPPSRRRWPRLRPKGRPRNVTAMFEDEARTDVDE